MLYTLKLYDQPLLRFSVLENLAEPVLKIEWYDKERENLLPLGMELSDKGLSTWIRHRSIPKNRAFVTSFLAKCGLSINRPLDVISVCRGLSLNDSYWIVDEDFDGSFEKNNLYENRFSRILGNLAFTGYGSTRSGFSSSPEFTTNGMLPKCWRRENGKIYLYKGATSGASNTGNEPYSELYAYEIGRKMGVNVIPYSIKKWKGQLCSVCELFTDKDTAFVPVGRIVKKGGMKAVREYYAELGDEYIRALNEMIVFDAVIINTDRHYGNFGVLVDSKTNRIIAPAPLFDHGNSLLNLAGEENWSDETKLQAYADAQLPQTYDDFTVEAKKYLDNDLRAKLRKLLDYEIEKGTRYNYPPKKLAQLNRLVQKRVRLLLE